MYTQPLLYTLIPVAAAAPSGAIAAVRAPVEQATSAVQHLAAGVVFAAAAIELVPGVLHSAPLPAIVDFALGTLVMFGLRHASDAAERRATRLNAPLAISLIATIGIDFSSTASYWAPVSPTTDKPASCSPSRSRWNICSSVFLWPRLWRVDRLGS